MPTVELVVADTFEITGRGLIVVTETPVSELPIAILVGHPITFRTIDDRTIETKILGLEFFGSPDPNRKFAFLIGTGIGKAMVPQGTRIEVEGQAPLCQRVRREPK